MSFAGDLARANDGRVDELNQWNRWREQNRLVVRKDQQKHERKLAQFGATPKEIEAKKSRQLAQFVDRPLEVRGAKHPNGDANSPDGSEIDSKAPESQGSPRLMFTMTQTGKLTPEDLQKDEPLLPLAGKFGHARRRR